MRMQSIRKGLLLSFLLGIVYTATTVHAFNPSQYGIAFKEGYLTGNSGLGAPTTDCPAYRADGTQGFYSRVLCDGVWVDNKADFITEMYDHLGGNAQEKNAASFIIYSMSGYTGSNKGLSRPFPVLPRDWNNQIIKDWKALIENPDVSVDVEDYSYSVNSAYTKVGGRHDIVFYSDSGTAESIVFRYKGDVVYVVKRECANPVGGSGFPDIIPTPPPAIAWKMTGWTDTSSTTVHPGQSVTFWHHVKNNGPDKTDSPISTDVTASGGAVSHGTQNKGTFTSGQDKTVFTDTVSFPATAATKNGDTMCARVGYNPSASGGGGYASGAQKCVTAVVDWTVTGQVVPHDITGTPITTAQPNTTVYFDYKMLKSGPDKAFGVTWKADPGVGNSGTQDFSAATTNLWTGNASSIAIPATAINGDTFCKTMTWTPKSSTNPAMGTAQACVTVTLSYTLTPSVTVGPSSHVSAGEDFTFSYNISNSTAYTTNLTNWAIRQTVTSPAGITINSPIPPSGAQIFAGSWSPRPTDTIINTYPVGTKICRYLRIESATELPGVVDEQGSCVLVAASPYLTIAGGNLWAGGSITSPYTGIAKVTASQSSTFGSFGDYGVFATGEIDYFGSAGQLGKASSTSGMVDGTRLTFANKKDPSSPAPNLGSYTSSHKIPDMLSTVPAGGYIGSGDIPSTSGVYTASSNITILASHMAPGTHITIYVPNNTVTIDGNITYDTIGVSSFAQLPSLTIVAKRIQINGTVAEIAGNFYASESFVTCYQGPENTGENILKSAAITSNPGAACNHRLDIHGAVTVANQATNSLVFNRSYGGTTAGDPAEVIQMRPEVFLTAYDLSAQSGNMTMTTVQETSLPPRY